MHPVKPSFRSLVPQTVKSFLLFAGKIEQPVVHGVTGSVLVLRVKCPDFCQPFLQNLARLPCPGGSLVRLVDSPERVQQGFKIGRHRLLPQGEVFRNRENSPLVGGIEGVVDLCLVTPAGNGKRAVKWHQGLGDHLIEPLSLLRLFKIPGCLFLRPGPWGEDLLKNFTAQAGRDFGEPLHVVQHAFRNHP